MQNVNKQDKDTRPAKVYSTYAEALSVVELCKANCKEFYYCVIRRERRWHVAQTDFEGNVISYIN